MTKAGGRPAGDAGGPATLVDLPKPLLVVVGPTASGKTEAAVRLAEAAGGEIVSADSVQVYRRFDVGTGKPDRAQRDRVPHHVIDVVDPDDPMDAARWVAMADRAIAEIASRGRRPIVCGGSFLWVRALLWGLAEAPPGDDAVRSRHRDIVAHEGRAALHDRLARVDPVMAGKLAPNDYVRVSRALEVYELTGRRMSDVQAEHGFSGRRYAAHLVTPAVSRDALDARIAARVRAMLASGWVDEVRRLRDEGHSEARPMASVGYRQVADALAAGAPIDMPSLEISIVRATRIFARRQRTWLRDRDVTPMSPSGEDDTRLMGLA